ncbi:MAG: hypothetical protein ABR599_11380 [Gemmatimonadota bacterium]
MELEALLLGGLECSLLPEGRRARLLQEWGAELDRLRHELGLEARLLGDPPRRVPGPWGGDVVPLFPGP